MPATEPPGTPVDAGRRLVVGLVRGVHGLRGTLRVEVLTDRPEARFGAGARLFPEGEPGALTVAAGEPVADGPGWWVRFRELPDRTSAEGLVGRYLEAAIEPEGEPGTGAAWWHEVIGVEVRDTRGRGLGRVTDVYRAGGAEVYLVEGGPLGPLDVPAVRSVVVEFAPRDGRLVVDAEALGVAEPRPRRPRGRRSSRRGAGGAQDGRPS